MLILMAGLPASGKSTLSRAAAAAIHAAGERAAVVLDKDRLRAEMFSSDDIEYSRQQNDRVMSAIYARAAEILAREPRAIVFIDGRPFARTEQLHEAILRAHEIGTPWKIIECVCSDASARLRLSAPHLARDRDYALRRRIAAEWQPITFSKVLIDTDLPLATCVERLLEYLRA